jgi:hypothetical protein
MIKLVQGLRNTMSSDDSYAKAIVEIADRLEAHLQRHEATQFTVW